jgi:hypothetical protein
MGSERSTSLSRLLTTGELAVPTGYKYLFSEYGVPLSGIKFGSFIFYDYFTLTRLYIRGSHNAASARLPLIISGFKNKIFYLRNVILDKWSASYSWADK